MTTTIQDTFDDVMHAVESKWLPIDTDSREAVRVAVMKAAAEGHDLFTAATVRKHLPEWVVQAQIGSVFNTLRARGYAVNTGHTARNEGPSRNKAKKSPVWRLLRPIPAEAVQS